MPQTQHFARVALTLLAAATWLCAPIAARAAKGEPVAIDATFKPAEEAGRLVGASEAKALKGLKRIAVAQFSVEFVTQDNVSAQTSGFGSAGRASATGYYKMVGVDEPDFQAIVEALHGRFLQQLRDGGIEVVGQDQVAASATWRRLAAGGSPLPQKTDKSITVGLPGTALYGASKAAATMAAPGPLGSLSAIGAGFAAVGAAVSAASENLVLQEELGGAALAEVSMRVHFAQLSNHNKGFFGRLSDQAKVSAKLHPMVTMARVSVQTGATVSTLDLKQPLLLDAEAFTELRTQSKSAGDVAGSVAVGLLRLAIGGKDSHSSESYEAVTEPARYRERVGAGLGSVGELFVARITAER